MEFIILIILFLIIFFLCMFFKYCIIENNTDSAYLDVSERNNRHLREIVNYDMESGHNSNIIPSISLNNINIINSSIIDIIDNNSNCYQSGESNNECIICLDNIEKGETVRNLRCMHKFHKKCIDDWLQRKHENTLICPVCEMNIIESYNIKK